MIKECCIDLNVKQSLYNKINFVKHICCNFLMHYIFFYCRCGFNVGKYWLKNECVVAVVYLSWLDTSNKLKEIVKC